MHRVDAAAREPVPAALPPIPAAVDDPLGDLLSAFIEGRWIRVDTQGLEVLTGRLMERT
jgi:hypothetical protein